MSKVLQNAPGDYSAILSTFIIKLPFVFKIFVLSIFEWPLKTSFTVHVYSKSQHVVLRDFGHSMYVFVFSVSPTAKAIFGRATT